MKTLHLITLLFFLTSTVFAQANKFQTAWAKVEDYKNSGFKNTDALLEALEAINETVKNESQSLKSKTWYYKGLVNHLIFENETLTSQYSNAIFDASEAYQKSLTVEGDKKPYEGDNTKSNLYNLAAQVQNKGAQLYNMNDFDNAYRCFVEVRNLKKFFDGINYEKKVEDTDATFNAALCLYKSNKKDDAKAFMQELIDKDYDSPAIYQILAGYYSESLLLNGLSIGMKDSDVIKSLGKPQSVNSTTTENGKSDQWVYANGYVYFENGVLTAWQTSSNDTATGSNAKALEILAKGMERYPDNLGLIIDELNIYIKEGREAESITKLEKAASVDSTNAQIYYALGAAYDKLENREQAEKAYLKCVSIDSLNHSAYNNLGALFYNQGITLNKEMMDNPKLTEKQFNEMQGRRNELYKKSLPYFERAYEIKSNDLSILQALKEVYAKLEMYDKSKAIKVQMDKVKAQ